MSYQSILVSLIIFATLIYAGAVLWQKITSFSKKGGCSTDCGCSGTPGNASSNRN